jgi:hypothetical protein
MIYLFAGDDAKTKRKAYEVFLDSDLRGQEVLFVSKNDFSESLLENFCLSGNLFFAKSNIVFENIFEKTGAEDFVFKKLPALEKSQNDFIFLEGKLDKKTMDAFKKVKTILNIFELPKEKKEKFNSFLLADAFADRDKLKLWIYFRQALEKSVAFEELIGVLFWKAKDMILKKNFRKFKEEELKSFCNKISYLLPEARRNSLDDEAAFEQFLLENI